jgi:tetratricopeptide (TPR) repeat protein
VLAFALGALLLAWRLASREATEGGALVALLLVASSPYALLHATEVVTEFPYLAVSVAAILVMTRPDESPSLRNVACAAALLTVLPFLRTIGIALVAAAAVYALSDRARRAWLPAPAVAGLATILWGVRNHFVRGPTYIGAIGAELERSGAGGLLRKSLGATAFYASRFLDVLLPGVWPGRPLYERMTIGATPDLGGLHGGAWVVAIAAIGLACIGIARRWRRDGALIAAYAIFFAVALVIYPPRHERLTWPLVPLCWALVPAGVAAMNRRAVAGVCLAAALGLTFWQGAASVAMARDNLAYLGDPERFYTEKIPPLYFADWQAAGRFIRDKAPAGARVLTRHSDTGLASGRLQDAIRFEELPPSAWRSRIAKLGARYLVVPTSLFGKFFPMDILRSDPAYTFDVVWQGGDVAVLEIAPNRTGAVVPPAPPDPALLAACDAAAKQAPDRVDLQERCAELLAEAGKRDEAIEHLRAILAKGNADVRVQVALGQLLIESRRDAEAAAAFKAAAAMPEAELLEQTIARGLAKASELAAAKSIDKTVRARTAVARARDRMDDLRWNEARALIEEAIVFAPYDPVVVAAAGDIALRRQDYDGAIGLYAQAGREGDAASAAKAQALTTSLATESALDRAEPDAIVAAARFWAESGTPGRALALLERASARFPSSPAIADPLAALRHLYGLD